MSKKTIVVAEDDKFIAHAYKNGLAEEGFDVHLAGDGQQALKLVKKYQPQLILLDLVMPVMNGFDALKALKEDKQTKAIPVIILSNLGQESDIETCRQLGIVDYLVKSNISMKEVIKRIKKHLK